MSTSSPPTSCHPDETIFCLFEGQEEAVRTASDRAGISVGPMLESVRVDGNPARRNCEPDQLGRGRRPLYLYMHA
jgi:hypothetical protein